MKASGIIYLVLIIAAVVFIFGSLAKDLNNTYPNEKQINTSQYESKYDYSSEINGSVNKLKEKFDTITDTEKSWFTKLGAGITAIPYAVIAFPLAIFSSFAAFGNIITDIGISLGIPPTLISLGLIALIVFAVMKLLEFFQRSPS